MKLTEEEEDSPFSLPQEERNLKGYKKHWRKQQNTSKSIEIDVVEIPLLRFESDEKSHYLL